jgi:hypothetical protein
VLGVVDELGVGEVLGVGVVEDVPGDGDDDGV